MSDRAAVVGYLSPPSGSFWAWQDAGQSIVWAGGGPTIAFRAELAEIAARLAPGGLPPLAALVLLLSATRDTWPVFVPLIQAHARKLQDSTQEAIPTIAAGAVCQAVAVRREIAIRETVRGLEAVAGLSAERRRHLAAKVVLAQTVFENANPGVLPELAEEIAEELRIAKDPGLYLLPAAGSGTAMREWASALDALAAGLSAVDERRLELRQRTSLEAVPQPADEDISPSDRVRGLLAEQADDPELGGIVRLGRELLAALNVPRTLHRRHTDEPPAGGVADISNRGPLDRLLVSELAHDDLTLAVRVAVSEALYLKREPPPQEPPQGRVILLDTGIRTWGVPRALAVSVGLALAATAPADRRQETTVFRPDGAQIVPVDLTRRDGVIDHLSKLDIWPHFGAALPSLARAAVGEKGVSAEVFLVSSQDALDDPEFRIALRQLDGLAVFAVGVERDGRVRLWSITPAGRTLLRSAVLNTWTLLEPSRSASPPAAPRPPSTITLPAIFSRKPMPLLVPPTSELKAVVGGKETGVIAITADRRLLHWRAMTWDQGPLEMTASLPAGRIHLLRLTGDGRAVAVIGGQGARRRGAEPANCIVVARLDSGQVTVRRLPLETTIHGVAWHRETVLIIARRSVYAYGLDSSQPLATLSTGGRGLNWRCGRFFTEHGKCVAVSYDGVRLLLDDVGQVPAGIQAVFEVPDVEGPLAMAGKRDVFKATQPDRCVLPGPGQRVVFDAISPDGLMLLVRVVGRRPAFYRLRLSPDSKWESVSQRRGWSATTAANLVARVRPLSLRTQLRGVSASHAGSLALWLQYPVKGLHFVSQGTNLRLAPIEGTHLGACHSFALRVRPEGFGPRLHQAVWADGSLAWLDSRGMLHLKSSDRSIPEVSLVLCADGTVAGWSSDGRVYGPRFFYGLSTSWDDGHLDQLIRRFAGRLR